MAAATADLSVGVGFLPISGRLDGLDTLATGAAVSVLAACATVVQPRAGRALDAGRLGSRGGITAGLLLAATGLGCATLPGISGVLSGAALIGAGTGLITPLGFAALAASTPAGRLVQTMGAAELGRELGDAGGPLLVAGVATLSTLDHGYAILAVLLGIAPAVGFVRWAAGARTPHWSAQQGTSGVTVAPVALPVPVVADRMFSARAAVPCEAATAATRAGPSPRDRGQSATEGSGTVDGTSRTPRRKCSTW